jgi:hypothetical protein
MLINSPYHRLGWIGKPTSKLKKFQQKIFDKIPEKCKFIRQRWYAAIKAAMRLPYLAIHLFPAKSTSKEPNSNNGELLFNTVMFCSIPVFQVFNHFVDEFFLLNFHLLLELAYLLWQSLIVKFCLQIHVVFLLTFKFRKALVFFG